MKIEQIEKAMSAHLSGNLPQHKIKDVYFYASLPAGKLFRPNLVWSICQDLNSILYSKTKENIHSNHSKFASAVEFHHTYTLLHDDLPAMDNDTERRGRACTHIAFGEWQALLAGDGLLNISYQLLTKIQHQRTIELLKFFSWALGPKGLIQGQVLDLSHEMTHSFQNTLRTHELKTARLIQVSILGSAILSLDQRDAQKEALLWKYSRLLGLNFQFLDDLSELAATELSLHEKDVNPWLHYPEETLNQTTLGLQKFETLSRRLNLKATNTIVSEYYNKMLSAIEPNQRIIIKNLNGKVDLAPVILLMKSFSNL